MFLFLYYNENAIYLSTSDHNILQFNHENSYNLSKNAETFDLLIDSMNIHRID